MLKCHICGFEFKETAEGHYISRDSAKIGITAAFSSDNEPKLYDAFDCPRCGCQYIAQERKRTHTPYASTTNRMP